MPRPSAIVSVHAPMILKIGETIGKIIPQGKFRGKVLRHRSDIIIRALKSAAAVLAALSYGTINHGRREKLTERNLIMDKTSVISKVAELSLNSCADLFAGDKQVPQLWSENSAVDIHDWSGKTRASFDVAIKLERRTGPGNFVLQVTPQVDLHCSQSVGTTWFIDRLEVYTGDLAPTDYFLESYAVPGGEARTTFLESQDDPKASQAKLNQASRYYSTVQQNCDNARLPNDRYCNSACRWRTELVKLKGGANLTAGAKIDEAKLAPCSFALPAKTYRQTWYFAQSKPESRAVEFYLEVRLYLRNVAGGSMYVWSQRYDELKIEFDTSDGFTVAEAKPANITISLITDAGERLSLGRPKSVRRTSVSRKSKANKIKDETEPYIATGAKAKTAVAIEPHDNAPSLLTKVVQTAKSTSANKGPVPATATIDSDED